MKAFINILQTIDGEEPCNWRPKGLDFTITKGVKWHFKDSRKDHVNNIDIVFCIDATESKEKQIEAAKSRSKSISDNSRGKFPDIHFRFGIIFYRDPIDCPNDINNKFQPTEDINALVTFMKDEKATGGGMDLMIGLEHIKFY